MVDQRVCYGSLSRISCHCLALHVSSIVIWYETKSSNGMTEWKFCLNEQDHADESIKLRAVSEARDT